MPKASPFLKASYSGPPLLVLLIVVLLVPAGLFCQDEESLGRQAEQAGKLREALAHYVAALQSTPEGSDKEEQLREKIIKVAQQIKPRPALPPEALRFEGRAQGAARSATSQADFSAAAKEYRAASRAAPWYGPYYFNLGVLLEKSGLLNDAARNFKLYLIATPEASDAADVQRKIGDLEYQLERKQAEERAAQERQQAEARAAAERMEANEQAEREFLENLTGLWTLGRGSTQTLAPELAAIASCRQTVPDVGQLYSIRITGHKVEIDLLQLSFNNCATAYRYPDQHLNLVVFEGTLKGNEITGTAKCWGMNQSSWKKAMSRTSSSDFYETQSRFDATLSWILKGRAFTMRPGRLFEAIDGNCRPQGSLTFDRE